MIQFTKIDPHPLLQKHINNYWHLTSSEKLEAICYNRIFPDGFTDIIFNLGDPYYYTDSTNNSNISYVSGIMTTTRTLGMNGIVDAIGISFRPGSAFQFLKVPISEFTDTIFGLHDIYGYKYHELEEKIVNAKTINRKIDFIESYLIDKLNSISFDRVIERSVEYIYKKNGLITGNELESLSGLSTRQIQRKFKTHIGLSPKTLSKIIRFREALNLLSETDSSIIDAAYESGFSDQAHLSREIKTLTGLTPKDLLNKNLSDVAFFQD